MNLELVEDDALIRELMGRFDHAVLALMRVGQDSAAPKATNTKTRWKGHPDTCSGLAMRALTDIQQNRIRMEESTDVEEEL